MLYHPAEPYGIHRSVAVRFAYAIACGQPVTVHEGTMRNFLYIPDACRMMKHLAESEAEYPEPVVLCNTEAPISIERVAEIMHDEISKYADVGPLQINREPKPPEIKQSKRPLLAKGLEQFLTVPQETGLRSMASYALRDVRGA
jgi:nucleoside-diphosphate-sugar epimerase